MKGGITILFLCLINFNFLYSAQFNISTDEDCVKKNAAIISQVLIETVGSDTVTQWLENGTRIVFICNVDSLGYVLNISQIKSKTELPDGLKNDLETFLILKKKQFYICYQNLPGLNSDESYKIILENLKEKKESFLIYSISFPVGEWFYLQYNRLLEEYPETSLTLFEYLQEQINKYLPNN